MKAFSTPSLRSLTWLLALFIVVSLACSSSAGGAEPSAAPAATGLPTQVIVQATATAEPTPDPTETPAPAPVKRTTIIFYPGPGEYSHLEQLALLNGIPFETIYNSGDFEAALSNPQTAAALIAGPYHVSDESALPNFVENGGKLLLVYNSYWTLDQNPNKEFREHITTNFQVGFFAEFVLGGGEAVDRDYRIQYPDTLLLTQLSGLTIEMHSACGISFDAYLETIRQDGEMRSLISSKSSKERLMVYQSEDGALTVFPMPMLCLEGYQRYFFDDEQIDYADNEAAALKLLQFLAGQ